ncbi:MAG: hypothetical protein JSS65_08305 [Armatimonadetes bacterium]|nr:hypothetical protein [Armatimonadota bacterium]
MSKDMFVSTACRAGAILALALGLMLITGCKNDEPGPSEVKLQANPYKKMMDDHKSGNADKPAAGAPGGAAPANK